MKSGDGLMGKKNEDYKINSISPALFIGNGYAGNLNFSTEVFT
jgi:hypothetical protein